jgi:hypothetical protein
MELLIILLVIVGIVWIISRIWSNARAHRRAELNAAWRTVLSDPDYIRRRHEEEGKQKERNSVSRAG